jgi:hypothetical protein
MTGISEFMKVQFCLKDFKGRKSRIHKFKYENMLNIRADVKESE